MSYVEQHMRTSLMMHTLEAHVDTPDLKGWYLRSPNGGRMMSTLILFTREGIVILGDLCPQQHGVISTLGYGVHWFAGKLSESYLCEKFLSRVFVPEACAHSLRSEIVTGRRENRIDKYAARDAYDDIAHALSDGNLSEERAIGIYDAAGLLDYDGLGYDYPHGDAGWLCAIQQRFAELYRAMTLNQQISA